MNKRETGNKFRFIPYRKHDIVEMCLQDNLLPGQENNFRNLYQMLDSTFHFEFHKVIEELKDTYASIDPDSDTRKYGNNIPRTGLKFADLLGSLLEKANYERVSEDNLNQALNESSLFQIRLHVDFNNFAEVLLFCRGETNKRENVPRFMGMFPKEIEFINYECVVVYIRFREDYEKSGWQLPSCRSGATLLKLFQNVPRADLEMLFPNTSVRMHTIDKILIGVPAVVSGGIVITTKLGASLVLLGSLIGFWLGLTSKPVELNKTALMALLAGVVALGGYLWKQFNNFKNRKLRFMQTLTQNFYFKNLDNNAGVFHRIVNDAEEEECKEAVLAYYFLRISERPLSRNELDRRVEEWMAAKWDCAIDFEIDDALQKLIRLGLVQETKGELTAVSIDESIKKLDQRWDAFFVTS